MRVINLEKSFRSKNGWRSLKVLDRINLDVEKGEIVVILGPSGCGKTTLLNILSGLEKEWKGKVLNVDLNNVGYMFQNSLLLPWRNLLDNVLIGLEVKGKYNKYTKRKAIELIKKYGLLEFQKEYPELLSGGMKQRVAFLRTIVIEPKILLLDEPFSSLDYEKKLQLELDLFNFVKQRDVKAVFVTHDIDEAIALGSKIVVLTNRPAKVKSIHNIHMKDLDPIKRRSHKDFSNYFKEIWESLKNEKEI